MKYRDVKYIVLLCLVACGSPAPSDTGNTFRPQDTTAGGTGSSNGTTSGTSLHRISNVGAIVGGAGTLANDVTITWRTDAAASATVVFAIVGGGEVEAKSLERSTEHRIVLRGLSEGNYRFKVRNAFVDGAELEDDNGGAGYSFRVAVAPIISSVAHTYESATAELVVSWSTSLPATSRVDVGQGDFGAISVTSDEFVTNHVVRVVVADAGSYVFRVVSIDETGDMAIADNGGAGFAFTVAVSVPLGTSQNPVPIAVASLPTTYSDATRSTANAPQSSIDQYPPATQQEMGPEYVYRFVLANQAKMVATVTDGAAVDVDIHLLSDLSPVTLWNGSALSRNDKALSLTLPAGTYYLALDSYGPDSSKAGPYTLNVTFSSPSSGGTSGGGSGGSSGGTTGGTTGGDTSGTCTSATRPTPNGVPSEVSLDGRCPNGMVLVPAATPFCIDKYEAMLVGLTETNAEFAWSPYSNPGSQRTKAMSIEGAVPQGYINRNQAEAACQNAGKRLCQSTEWLRACQSAAGFTYPYGHNSSGDVRQPGVCNDARSPHPAVEYFGANDPNTFSKLGHPCINQLPNSLAKAGEREGCVASDGPQDMMGNLHEWVDDLVSSGPRTGNGIFRGGYYVDTVINGNGCLYRTTAHAPSHWDYSTGFRCCATP